MRVRGSDQTREQSEMTRVTGPAATERSGVKSAVRVLTIIELFDDTGLAMTFTEVLRHLTYPRSSLHDLLRTLTDRGWLDYDRTTRRYSLRVRTGRSAART